MAPFFSKSGLGRKKKQSTSVSADIIFEEEHHYGSIDDEIYSLTGGDPYGHQQVHMTTQVPTKTPGRWKSILRRKPLPAAQEVIVPHDQHFIDSDYHLPLVGIVSPQLTGEPLPPVRAVTITPQTTGESVQPAPVVVSQVTGQPVPVVVPIAPQATGEAIVLPRPEIIGGHHFEPTTHTVRYHIVSGGSSGSVIAPQATGEPVLGVEPTVGYRLEPTNHYHGSSGRSSGAALSSHPSRTYRIFVPGSGRHPHTGLPTKQRKPRLRSATQEIIVPHDQHFIDSEYQPLTVSGPLTTSGPSPVLEPPVVGIPPPVPPTVYDPLRHHVASDGSSGSDDHHGLHRNHSHHGSVQRHQPGVEVQSILPQDSASSIHVEYVPQRAGVPQLHGIVEYWSDIEFKSVRKDQPHTVCGPHTTRGPITSTTVIAPQANGESPVLRVESAVYEPTIHPPRHHVASDGLSGSDNRHGLHRKIRNHSHGHSRHEGVRHRTRVSQAQTILPHSSAADIQIEDIPQHKGVRTLQGIRDEQSSAESKPVRSQDTAAPARQKVQEVVLDGSGACNCSHSRDVRSIRELKRFIATTLVGAWGLLLAVALTNTERFSKEIPWVWVLFGISADPVVGFVYAEGWVVKEPIISLKSLRQRTPFAVVVTNFLVPVIAFSVLYNVLICLTTVQSVSTQNAGQELLPNAVALASLSVGAGVWIGQTVKIQNLTLFSATFCALSSVLLATWGSSIYLLHVLADIFFSGFGGSSFITTTLIAIIASVGRDDITLSRLFRTTGKVIVVASSGAILQTLLVQNLEQRITGPGADKIIRTIRHSTTVTPELEPPIQAAIESYTLSLRAVFDARAGIAALTVLASLAIQKYPLPWSYGKEEEHERQRRAKRLQEESST